MAATISPNPHALLQCGIATFPSVGHYFSTPLNLGSPMIALAIEYSGGDVPVLGLAINWPGTFNSCLLEASCYVSSGIT